MHEAYEVIPIIRKLPAGLQIESIAAYDDVLLLGTKSGNLLMYQVLPKSQHGKKDNTEFVKLISSYKSSAKRPIIQLEVVPELKILVCLSDSVISVYDLSQNTFRFITNLQKTKGAHLFALDVKHEADKDVQCTVRMCVVVKRKLQLYHWRNKDFQEYGPGLAVYDTPKTMAWCGEALIIGYKSEYFWVKVTGDTKDLFPTGRQLEPLIAKLQGEKLALGRDKQTICVDSEGNPTMKFAITWTDAPLALGQDPPYLIALLPSHVEIRAPEQRILIQNIDLNRAPRLIASGKKGWVFVASSSDVWHLCAVNLQKQIMQLVQEKHFELALRLVNMTDDSEDEKQQYVHHIQNLYAFHFFCNKDFKESMNIFFKLETNPSEVIGLFPDLLPEDYRNTLEYPDKLPVLEGSDLENGLFSLTEYLVQVRHKMMKDISGNSGAANVMDHSKKQLLQIIDTTLLKCYLQTNDALVASLLRMPDNHCHVEESERALRKYHKFSELIILYNKKKSHNKALDLLKKQAKKQDSPLKGHEKTVQYLQHLGKEHLNLIFEYAEWVIKGHQEDGLKIFIEDLAETESLPRHEVLDYLEKIDSNLVIPYLEHILFNWRDTTPLFHNTLIKRYCEKIRHMMPEYLDSLPEGQPPAVAGNEPGLLGELRQKLISFLTTSTRYTEETFPTHLFNDGLFEEGAVVMGRLGKHEEALTIYTHILQNPSKAEEYCHKYYNKDKPGDKDVYFLLLKMYLCPPDKIKLNVLAAVHINQPCVRQNVEAAIYVLSNYSSKIDPFKALAILPVDAHIGKLQDFLFHVLQNTVTERHSSQLIKSLLLAEHLQVQDYRIQHQNHKLVVTDVNVCRVCQKRIGKSAFARFPNGVIVHYSCKDRYNCES